jgi:ion channel-forming bestrophin family protein
MLRNMGKRLGALYRAGDIDSIGVRTLDERLTAIAAVQAANERIANTPLPFAYSLLVHRTAYLYCFLVPFGLASSVGWFAPFLPPLSPMYFLAWMRSLKNLKIPMAVSQTICH